MNNRILAQGLGIPVSSITYQAERTPKRLLQDHPATQYHVGSLKLKQSISNILENEFFHLPLFNG